eukprot:GGOE01002677.1.p1 GENE.GGOE01002677.1~~GGOE01002677.1.p1  ORF type:complete len:493 (-),score=131.22 GGOE01002677.1:465-1943(-)
MPGLRPPSWLCPTLWLLLLVLPAVTGGAFLGVNLGGWLLMEDWMFPEYFQGISPPDEHTLIRKMGGNTNPTVIQFMKRHWDAFLSEGDLDRLSSFGITHVRIPVGYWIIDWQQEDGFVDGGLFYLERCIQWLQRRSMKALVDLHALPGAQTPHQSFTACANCYAEADAKQFWKPPHYNRGKEAMRKLALLIQKWDQEEATKGVATGLELVNEPDAHKWVQVQSLYSEMVPKLRTILPAQNYSLYLSFMNDVETSATWMKQKVYQDPANWANVIYDRHLYHAFLDDDTALGPRKTSWSPESTDACKTCCRDPLLFEHLTGLPVVIGEWSLTVDTFDTWEYKDPRFLQGFWRDQLSLWANVSLGSFFFTFKIGPSSKSLDYFVNFDLLKLIASSGLPAPWDVDTSSLCPARPLDECPRPADNVDWDLTCAAFGIPKGAGARHIEGEDRVTDYSSPIPLIMFLIFGPTFYVSMKFYVIRRKQREYLALLQVSAPC